VHPLLLCKSNSYYAISVSICSFRRPTCKAHATYFIVISGLSGFTVFFHIISKRHDFRKKILNIKLCFNMLYNFCLKYFSSEEELGEIWSEGVDWSPRKVPVVLNRF
jgi:hypothetical protein